MNDNTQNNIRRIYAETLAARELKKQAPQPEPTTQTKLPLWKLEKKLEDARLKYVRTEAAFREAERELWAARLACEQRRKEYEGR